MEKTLVEKLESLPPADPPCTACNGRGWFIKSAVNQNIVRCEKCEGTGEAS